MLAAGRQIGKKRRLSKAGIDNASLAITTSIQRTYLVRKWYDVLKGATTYTPVSNASTTADECGGGTISEWAWRPPYSTFQLPQTPSANTNTGASPTATDQPPPPSAGLWFPFLTGKQSSIDTGRRFFARFSSPQTQPLTRAIESWRQSQSEDTYGLDEKIVKLLTTESNRLPKPCDPLTYCFWKHGMRRQFEPIQTTRNSFSSSSRNSMTFSVCSYNVLCQRTLGYYLELYSHCPFEHLTWQRRWPLLAVELQMLDADIFCLQEVEYDHFEQHYMPFLSKLGYDGTFKKKLRKKSDGCATFWRRDKFRPVHVHPVEYAFPAPHDHSDCVALITVLEPLTRTEKGSSGRVVVANTHLIYQPALGATKLCQAALLLAHLQKVTRQYTQFESGSALPLILCGDFNSTPFSPLYSLLIEGQLQYEGLNGWAVSGQKQAPNTRYRRLNTIGDTVLGPSLLPKGSDCSELCILADGSLHTEDKDVAEGCLSHSLNLRSVYDHTTKYGEREVTMFLPDQSVAVDHIFYSVRDKKIHKPSTSDNGQSAWTMTNIREDGLRCLERYRLPGATQLHRTIGYLPNQYCASDHLPLMAKFALETSQQST